MIVESSLRAFDSPADRIRQHRQASNAPFILVEGPDDSLVLEPHMPPDVVQFPLGGKRNVASVSEKLVAWGIDRFVGVTDADFDLTDAYAFAHLPLHHPYEHRDLEGMLIELGVLKKVIVHLGSPGKLEKNFGGADNLVLMLLDEAAPIARLKSQNQILGWGLAFDSVDLHNKIDKSTLKLEIEPYCSALLSQAADSVSLNLGHLLAVATDVSHIVEPSGKDVISFAGVALRKQAGSLSLAAAKPEVLASAVRSSCDLALSKCAWMHALLDAIERFRLV